MNEESKNEYHHRAEQIMKVFAKLIDATLKGEFEEDMGFILLIYPHSKEGIAHYVSNSKRSDIIPALRETADRLEKNKTPS